MKLTKNFNLIEFASKDGSKTPEHVISCIQETADNLQILRDFLKEPISINSAYRSVKHNRAVGGNPGSKHLEAIAVDIAVRSKTPNQLSRIIIKLINKGILKQGGIGLYNGFVHYDIRGTKVRWDNSSWYNVIEKKKTKK